MGYKNKYLQAAAATITDETLRRVDNMAKYRAHKSKYLVGDMTLTELYKYATELLGGDDLVTEKGWFETQQYEASTDARRVLDPETGIAYTINHPRVVTPTAMATPEEWAAIQRNIVWDRRTHH